MTKKSIWKSIKRRLFTKRKWEVIKTHYVPIYWGNSQCGQYMVYVMKDQFGNIKHKKIEI